MDSDPGDSHVLKVILDCSVCLGSEWNPGK